MFDRNNNTWMAALLAVMIIIIVRSLVETSGSVVTLPYSEFDRLARQGDIQNMTVSDGTIRGDLKNEIDGATRYQTYRIDPELVTRYETSETELNSVPPAGWFVSLLSWIMPFVLIMGFWLIISRTMMRRSGGGGYMSIGQSKAKIFVESETGVNFDDVAGVDEAKAELMEVVDFLQNPDEYKRLGAHIPKGVLLVGPPGTGKTLLARAVAGEARVSFYSISGSEFVELFVGVGAARVRDLFAKAKASAPSIIFIDELDALGRARTLHNFTGNDEREQTLNQLLAELDGFDPSSGVVLLAATNRPEILDPALLRAGRFDRQVLVDRPDRGGRVAILRVHTRKVSLGSEVDLDSVAAMTPGFSGADLANLVNEAAILATRRSAQAIETNDFENAVERIIAGLERRNRVLNPEELETIAVHETGHAITALALPGTDPVRKVSIIPRGIGALGYTIQTPTEDRYVMRKAELENKICTLLGGRAAEALMFKDVSTGAADDLAKATEIARSMVEIYGMDEDLGHVTFQQNQPSFLAGGTGTSRSVSEVTAERIDQAVASILKSAFERAFTLLSANKTTLEDTAKALMKKETLDEGDLSAVKAALVMDERPAKAQQA